MPQRVLLTDADEQCDIAILGQTLTSNVSGSGGNRALGQVHADTEIKVLNGVSDFIESVINTQLIPAIIMMNYGETSELPYVEGSMEVPADELVLAQRDFILFQQMDLPVAKDFLYARHSVPEPAEDAELYEPVAAPTSDFHSGDRFTETSEQLRPERATDSATCRSPESYGPDGDAIHADGGDGEKRSGSAHQT